MMGKMIAVGLAEGELEDLHPGKTERLTQPRDLGSDESEILRDHRKISQSRADRGEELVARSRNPAPIGRGLLRGRDLPVIDEAAEVVQSHQIRQPQVGSHPLDPPVIALLLHPIPAVGGIPPELAGGTEVVGRNAADPLRPPLLGELEEARVGPDIGAVEGRVDRQVAHDPHSAPMGRLLQPVPLEEEEELQVLVVGDLLGHLLPHGVEGSRLAPAKRRVPARPFPFPEASPQGGIQRPVREPSGLLRAFHEGAQLLADSRGSVKTEALPGKT